MFPKQLGNLGLIGLKSPIQRRPTARITGLTWVRRNVWIGPGVEQYATCVQTTMDGCRRQRGFMWPASSRVESIYVRTVVKEDTNDFNVSSLSSGSQRRLPLSVPLPSVSRWHIRINAKE